MSGTDGSFSALESNSKFRVTAKELSNYSGDNHYVPITLDKPLVEAMEVMTHDYPNLHRLPVVDDNGKLVGILSQSLLVKFLGQHVSKFDFASLPVKQTHVGLQKVISVNVNDKVSAALRAIKENKVSAVAVVDVNGVLVGNFSATDLKAFGYDDTIGRVATGATSLREFVDTVKPKARGVYPVIATTASTTEEVIEAFTSTGVQRIWVVDGAQKPIGVISLVDIINLFVRHFLIE